MSIDAHEPARAGEGEASLPATVFSPSSADGSRHKGATDGQDVEKAREKEDTPASTEGGEDDDMEYPSGLKLYIIMAALLVAEFLVGIDQTIIATATATVANEFHALTDVGWYGSAYLLTCCCLQPIFGRFFGAFPKDRVFLAALILFELGTLVSAVAQSSRVFILGRAIQGSGYAGIFIGELLISQVIFPVRLQPIFTSMMGASYGLGAVIGPLIGGALTTRVGWRWCFYVFLPPGAIIILVVLLWVRPPHPKQKLSILQRLLEMDWAGAVLLLASTICLLIALQEGGITHAWHDSRIFGLLIGFGLLFAAFIGLQFYLGERASLSMRLMGTRTGFFTSMWNFSTGATYYSILYYVPVFFQAVLGASALSSGVRSIPIVVSVSASGMLSGFVITRGLPFNYCMLVGGSCTAIGAGLLAMMDENVTTGQYIGYQIIAGIGMGTSYMLAFIASQVLSLPEDRPNCASLVSFWQVWGATVWVSTSEAIYQGRLLAGVEKIPGVSVQAILDSGVSGFREVVSGEQLVAVIKVACGALFDVEVAIAAVAAAGVLSAVWLRWKAVE